MEGWAAALLALVTGALASVATALVNIMRARAELKQKAEAAAAEGRRAKRKDAVDEVWKYVAELKAQNERQQAVIEQHTRAVEAFSRENADCREESAELRQCVIFLHDHLKRCFGHLRDECGHDPGELPELPAPRSRSGGSAAEFLGRQAQQSAQLLREADQVIKPPPAPPPAPPGTNAQPPGGPKP